MLIMIRTEKRRAKKKLPISASSSRNTEEFSGLEALLLDKFSLAEDTTPVVARPQPSVVSQTLTVDIERAIAPAATQPHAPVAQAVRKEQPRRHAVQTQPMDGVVRHRRVGHEASPQRPISDIRRERHTPRTVLRRAVMPIPSRGRVIDGLVVVPRIRRESA